jgi:hypothetical protein
MFSERLKSYTISTVRVAFAAGAGLLITLLTTHNLLSPEVERHVASAVESLSFVAATVIYYFLARLLQERFPFLLGPRFPGKTVPENSGDLKGL